MSEQPEHIIQFFKFDHLPPKMQEVSKPFAEQAHRIVETLPRNPERTVALRKLLEAKDAAVRAFIAIVPTIAVMCALALLPACDHVKHAASSFVDCVSAPQGPIQNEIDKLWSQRKSGASWTDVGKTAEADAKGATFSGIAGCAFFTLEQEVLGTKDGVAAPPVTESNEMRIAGEKIRAAEGGPTYRTKFGDL